MQAPTDIVKIATRALYGEVITNSEAVGAHSSMSSPEAVERAAACVVLMLSKSTEISAARVAECLTSECASQPDEQSEFWLGLAVGLLEESAILANPSVRFFVYRCAFSMHVPCRANAMTLLGRLSAKGDQIATRLLQIGKESENERVKTNAVTALSDSDC